jgi:hypothetical protein
MDLIYFSFASPCLHEAVSAKARQKKSNKRKGET